MHNKEREQLKWEYLKRSDLYREYCEWQRRKVKNQNLAIPEKFKPVTGPIFDINPIVHTYIEYGDIHKKSFDDWYAKYYGHNYQGSSLARVDDLSKGTKKNYYLYGLFVYIIKRFERINKREPTLLEMADCLLITMREKRGDQSFLRIVQSDFTTEEAKHLADDVYKILKTRVPTNRFHMKNLKKYLIVYDMRKAGQSNEDIIKKIYAVENRQDVTGKRSKDAKADKELIDEINKYFKYAERLIENAERDIYSDVNVFPGDYYKS